jgi:iron complex outermembrane receptor protein
MNERASNNCIIKLTVFIILYIAIVPIVIAQSGSIKGKVTDPHGGDAPIVNLLSAKDSSVVKATICEEDGSFEFQFLKDGRYLVNITLLGYHGYMSPPIEVSSSMQAVQLPDVSLTHSTKELQEVEVVAKKPFVQRKIDRVVINPDALISNAGTTALEVLEKSPGVRVDMNGAISLKGKPGVMVFIDDKPTYMSATDLAAYLRSLPSGSIESIELMTNPPAKYEAAGNAGIINIRLKRDKAKGFNGGVHISYGQGRYMRSNNSVNFNYSINKINFFSNIGWNEDNFYHNLTINRYYYTPGGELSSAYSSNSYIRMQNSGRTARAGLDYYVSKKSTLGIVLSGFINPGVNTFSNNAQALNANNEPTSVIYAYTSSKRTWKNGSANLNYSYKIDEKGKEFTANLDYIAYHSDQSQELTNSVFAPDHVLIDKTILASELPVDITIQSGKIDYTHPLDKAGKLDAGVKASFVHTDNIASFYDVVNTVYTPNYEFSNRFQYKENIYAGYLNYSKEWKKFSLQLGVRVENTGIDGHQLGNPMKKDSSFLVSYTRGFPTCYFSYKADSAQKNQFIFSFGRRINRPDYQDMNPFTYPLDRYTYYGGNPFLKPTYSYNFEFSHTYKSLLTTTLAYNIDDNLIQETNEQRGTIYYSRPGNFGRQTMYGISVNGNFNFTKWWVVQLYTECKNVIVKSAIYGQTIDEHCWYWYVNPTNQFIINKKLSAELGGWYITSVLSGQFLEIPTGAVRVGAAYKILKDKGTVKLNLSDAFYTNQPGGDIRNIANSKANWFGHMDTRVLSLSFSYRFNKGKTRQERKSGAADTEKERVKTN